MRGGEGKKQKFGSGWGRDGATPTAGASSHPSSLRCQIHHPSGIPRGRPQVLWGLQLSPPRPRSQPRDSRRGAGNESCFQNRLVAARTPRLFLPSLPGCQRLQPPPPQGRRSAPNCHRSSPKRCRGRPRLPTLPFGVALFLLPFGRPRGLLGVGASLGSCWMESRGGGRCGWGSPEQFPTLPGSCWAQRGAAEPPGVLPAQASPPCSGGGHGHILRGAGSTGTSSGSSWGPSGPAGALQPAVVAVTHPAPLLIPRLSGTLPAGSQSGCPAASLLLILTPHPPGFLPISPLPCVV